MTAFDVDLAELRGAVAELVACQRDLLALAGDIDDAQAQVQQDWLGLAGAAQDAAYGTWRDQCAEMVTALAAMRAVVAAADAHYTTAVEANLALWRQVSA
jgi:WXG100 family type VII secretion target